MRDEQSRRTGAPEVHGVLLVDKAYGVSSGAVVAQARRHFNTQQVGHTGTLDPLATGLLPLCLGEATKIAGWLLDAPKEYVATIALGTTTTSYDREGEVVAHMPAQARALSDSDIEAALGRFRGTFLQMPPQFSAIKTAGQRAFDRARRGEQVALAPREVTIYALQWLSREGTNLQLRVSCGKGTYIRSLAHDLGEALGCGAHLAALRRTRVSGFQVNEASTEVAAAPILPIEQALGWPVVMTPPDMTAAIRNGKRLPRVAPEQHVLLATSEELLALAEHEGDSCRILRGFAPGLTWRQNSAIVPPSRP